MDVLISHDRASAALLKSVLLRDVERLRSLRAGTVNERTLLGLQEEVCKDTIMQIDQFLNKDDDA